MFLILSTVLKYFRIIAIVNKIAMEPRIYDQFSKFLAVAVGLILVSVPGAQSWSKEGHIVTCRIAQVKSYKSMLATGRNCTAYDPA